MHRPVPHSTRALEFEVYCQRQKITRIRKHPTSTQNLSHLLASHFLLGDCSTLLILSGVFLFLIIEVCIIIYTCSAFSFNVWEFHTFLQCVLINPPHSLPPVSSLPLTTYLSQLHALFIKTHWIYLALPVRGWTIHWRMSSLSGATNLKTYDSPSSRTTNYQ